jgi:hypothetical protein
MVKLSDEGKWYRVSLRLMGDRLLVDEVEGILGLAPSNSGKKGESYRFGNSYLSNVWVWKYPESSDVPFEEQILGLLAIIEPKKQILRSIIEAPGVKGELFLGFGSMNGQGGAYFSSDLLRRVADCGLALHLDLYPPNGAVND